MLSDKDEKLKEFELFENERYTPISGWSTKSLFPNDRKAFSTGDGSVGWSSLQEAENALLSKGWTWSSERWVGTVFENADEEGWAYSTDFQSFINSKSGSKTKTMLHYVRRRRWIRIACFDESLICSTEGFTCDHCDLKEVLAISELMLKYFTTATLNRFPRSITILKAVEVKNDLVCALDLPDSSDPMYYTRNFIEERLQAFSKEGINALSMASATLARNDAKDTRENEVNDFHLPAWEREELALMVLRKHDLHFDYHCELQNCGNQCIFIREKCSNGDCSVIYSKKWFAEHDSVCPYKKVDCERRCGVLIERMNMEKHMTTTCSLMPVTCHFAEFGCKEVGLVLVNYEQHLKDQQFQHLQFTVTRVKEHQAVITKLHKQIKELSAENETTKKELVAVGVTLAASQVALKAAETKNEKQLSNQISKLDDKYKRQLQALQTHTDSLVNEKLAKQEQDFSRRLKEMTTYYNEKLSTIR